MIQVDEANAIILNNTHDFGQEEIELNQSIGRILRKAVFADRDFPPFDRVCMDGIAINFNAYKRGQRSFPIEKIQAAGEAQKTLENTSNCVEVMTGATLPANTTTVIRYEDLTKSKDNFEINIDIKDAANIHTKGIDIKEGALIIPSAGRIEGPEIGIFASVGKSMVTVSKLPKIVILSTGDELIEVDQKPLPHQIRKSNVWMLKSALKKLGIEADTHHIKDDLKEVENNLNVLAEQYDVLLLSGGVSMGKFDYLPTALANLKFDKLFHKVAQRPGKPFWFGRRENTFVFAFPGNPASTFLCFKYYFESWLHHTLGLESKNKIYAYLEKDFEFKPPLTYFAQAKIKQKDGKFIASIQTGKGSGDMINLVHVDGFIKLPAGEKNHSKEKLYEFIPFRNMGK